MDNWETQGIYQLFDDEKLFSDLKFQYEEEQEYARFFLPYIWSLVHRHGMIHWTPARIALVTQSLLEVPFSIDNN